MASEIHLSLSAKQKRFMLAKEKHIAYGGARGGGKSWAVRVKAMLLALRYPGIKVLIVRRTYTELDNNHIQPLLNLLAGLAKYNKQEKRFIFPNGSFIQFGYCDNTADMMRYQGAEFDVIFLDEATNLEEEWIKMFQACIRGVNDFPKRCYYTCNPGGVSHGYIKRLFVDRRFERGEKPEDYTFIQAKVTDNPALMRAQPEYKERLEALPPKLRAAWLEGSWNIFEGQFFEDFIDDPEHYRDRKLTHVIDPFRPDPAWPVYRSFDWGYNRPFSCGWWTVDRDGVIYRIAELYGVMHDGTATLANQGVKWPPERVFAEIQRTEREHPYLAGHEITGVADPAIWDAEMGTSIAETAAAYSVFFSRGDNRRIPGWMQCHYRLMFDEEGYPQMYVFKTCRDFIRTIPTLQYDEHRVEDLDTAGEDHAADEWRYFCMSRPIRPAAPEEEYNPRFASDPLNLYGRR